MSTAAHHQRDIAVTGSVTVSIVNLTGFSFLTVNPNRDTAGSLGAIIGQSDMHGLSGFKGPNRLQHSHTGNPAGNQGKPKMTVLEVHKETFPRGALPFIGKHRSPIHLAGRHLKRHRETLLARNTGNRLKLNEFLTVSFDRLSNGEVLGQSLSQQHFSQIRVRLLPGHLAAGHARLKFIQLLLRIFESILDLGQLGCLFASWCVNPRLGVAVFDRPA